MIRSVRLMNALTIVLLLLVAPLPSLGAENRHFANILILNSYHPGFSWSDEEESGVIEQLHEKHPSIDVFIEYLDAKRYPGKGNLERMKRYLIDKYHGKQIDLIFALDDAAVDLLTNSHTELFPGIPVVFTGITSFDQYADRGRKHVTGVLETQDVKNTIATALRLQPDTNEILVISDTTVTGIAARKEAEAIIPMYAGRVKIRFLPTCRFDEVLAAVAALNSNSIVLLNSYATDSAGETFSTEDSTRMIVSAAKVPVYGVHEHRLGDGIVGGYLLCGREQGEKAARIGLRILAGENPDTISIDEARKDLPMFDYRQMERFGIPISKLPEGSLVINKPVSVFTAYREFAIRTTVVLILLVIAVLLLAFFILRLLQAKAKLLKKTEELDSIFDLSLDLLCIISSGGGFRRLNPAWECILGYSLDELEGKGFIDLVHPEDLAESKAVFELSAKKDIIDFVNRYRCKDGCYRWFEWRFTPYPGTLIYAAARDITERKQAEKKLRHLSETWKLAQKMANIGHWSHDVETQKPVWSEQMFLILGFDPQQPIPTYETFLSILHPDDRGMFDNVFQEAINGTPYNVEARAILPDGTIRWFNTQAFCRYDQKGNVVQLFGMLQDITERKRAEEALRFTQYAIDKAAVQAFWMTDEGDFVYVNDAACRALGYSREELLKLSITDIEAVHDPENFSKGWQNSREKRHRTLETLHRTKDGRVYPVAVSLNFVVFDGKEYNCAFATDITERKRMEQSLRDSESFQRTLFRAIPDLIWLKNPDGVFLACNTMFGKLLGATEEEIVGRTDYDFVDKDLADAFLENDRKAIAAGKPTTNEQWVIFPDGNKRVLLETIKTPMIGDQGKIIGILGVSRDITERKKNEEEQAKLRSQLQQAQKMESVGRLAGGVAHDFNNMLSVIIGYSELALKQTDPSHNLHTALQEIIKAAKRSANITRQLLAFARKQTVSPKVIDINDTVTGMTRMLQRFIGEDIELAWKPAEAVWPMKMDPSQIDQILANLCVNARDAIADVGKITIETGNVVLDEAYCAHHLGFLPGEYVLLAVSDTGHGMDAKIVSNIFEPFFTTKESGKGTGLGLATVYGIVKQNKGFINVYSEPGQGTTFKIYLPRHTVDEDYLPEKKVKQPVKGGNETILLVEDEDAILDITTTMLEILGYRTMASNTPNQAIDMAQAYSGKIDLLITDVVMPEMNGRNLAKRIQSIYPNLKCLFMSGYTANVIAHHGVLDEGVNFISKPFSKEKLGAKVREALDGDNV